MNLTLVDRIANAVLYEGYMLYPYRASAVKNRQRWNFGAVCPETFSVASGGTDACVMQTQCLVAGNDRASIDVKVRFLHLLAREVAVLENRGIEDGELRMEDRDGIGSALLDLPLSKLDPHSSIFRQVESLEVEGKLFQTWQEAVEREASMENVELGALRSSPVRMLLTFPTSLEEEVLRDAAGEIVGTIVRRQELIEASVDVSAEALGDQLFKLTARISNLTPLSPDALSSRNEALMRSLVSTHTILGVRGGEFVSLLEPPDALREPVAVCSNIGTYPVLVGEGGERDLMLSSPIILYDYPQIAPESAGELFDSTEIDEILTLRIMTLTEEEKREMRSIDDRARRILERTETMPLEQLLKLHGAVRGLRPVGGNTE